MNLSQTLRSLAHRNFRLFFVGQGVSLIGTWMQQLAMQWVIYDLTRKEGEPVAAFWLGMVGFASQIPAFFLAPVAGVLVDHWSRHRIIILTQMLSMVQAFLLGVLTLTNTIDVPWIMALSVMLGLINAFDMPARQAFMTEMIDTKEDLSNAIALNSSMFNGARLVGPALAAILLAVVGAAACFLLNGASYLAVLAALFAMRVPRRAAVKVRKPLYKGMQEGLIYTFGFAPIRAILTLVALLSLAGMSYSVLLPVIATRLLRGDNVLARLLPAESAEKVMLGMLTTAAGFGALCGAIYLARRPSVLGLGRWIMMAPGMGGLALLAFSFSETPWLSLPLLAVVGFSMMVSMGASNIVVQTIVDEDKRGRVMSFYTMAFMGMSPLGSLLAGFLAGHFSLETSLRVGGGACLLGSVAFAFQFRRLRALVRPIYMRLGILPEMASGVYPAVGPPSPVVEPAPQTESAA